MKILIVAFWFPPSNVIGAVRVGKLARYLDRRGHDVHVLTTDIGEDRSLPVEIPEERVVYTEYRDSSARLDILARPFRRRRISQPANGGGGVAQAATQRGRLRYFLRRQYLSLMHIPDMRAGWVKTAIPAGSRLIEEWRPELIFASGPPHTGLIVASRLATAFDIPWVADLRDLWVDNPYYSEPGWRKPIDAVLERRTLRSAAGLVTVSPIWAAQLHRSHGKVAEVVYNGYAAEDFPPFAPQANDGEVLTIRYLGSIYRGFRDPSAVFAALAMLPEPFRKFVAVEFYCDSPDAVLGDAAAHGVTDAVLVKPLVPYRRALELQMNADVLLLLQSNDRRDEGNLPAKLFEYLYARRPILFIGYEHGIAAQMVKKRDAGLVSNSPEQIRDQLEVWCRQKRAGRLERLDPSVSVSLSRDEQYQKLEHLFEKVLKNGSPDKRLVKVANTDTQSLRPS